jgi:hypothetical protein
MIIPSHASLLGEALAAILGTPERGTLAFVRCLPSEIIDDLVADPSFRIRGFAVYAVVDREGEGLITADRAVELREDKGDPLLLIIDPRRAGAGLDGIYSAGREVSEQQLFEVGNDLARKRLGHGRIGFARHAVRAARRVGRRAIVAPWQEFDFLLAASDSVQAAGVAVARLGLWPIAVADRLLGTDIDLSAQIVNRLLFARDATASPPSRIAGLMLDNPSKEQLEALERFLREAATLDPLAAVRRLQDRPLLWLNNLKTRFASNDLHGIEIISWRNDHGKLLAWSGLHESSDGKPRFAIDPNTAGKRASKLEVRWQTMPGGLPKGAVDYQVDVMSADETLASRTVSHKQTNPQKAVFAADDFEEFDESARFEAFIRVFAPGRDDVIPQDTEEFLLEIGQAPGNAESSSGKVVRCLVEGAIGLATQEEFSEAAKSCSIRVVEDRKGYVVWRAGPGAGRTFKVSRPPLIAEMEKAWHAHGGRAGRWQVRVRADGSRTDQVKFLELEQGECPVEVWERVLRAGQRLASESAQGPGLIARILAPPWSVAEEFVLAWGEALVHGPPALALVNTIEVLSLSGKTIGVIVTPAHPLRLAWHAAYDLLAAHARYDESLSAVDVNRLLASLDSAHFPAMIPGSDQGHGFVFGDTLGFHAVAMVADHDTEPKAAIALMAACLAEGRAEIAPSVGSHTAEVLARELRHYIDCHTRTQNDTIIHPDFLQLHARKAGDAMTVVRAVGKVIADLSPMDGESEEKSRGQDLCVALDLFPTPDQTIISGRYIADVGRRHRSGAGRIDRQDRWMIESVRRSGDVMIPRLRWARRTDITSVPPAHVALSFNHFVSRLDKAEPVDLSSEPRPIHAYGLIAPLERHVSFDEEPTWRLFMPSRSEGEKHPARRAATERLGRLHDTILRATARNIGGGSGAWPLLATRLTSEEREAIERLHGASDWVITIDRNACVEYFDSPRETKAIYDAYVIDCVPERDDLGNLQLVTSTTNTEEVRTLLDRALSELGLSGSERNCRKLLDHLKALSGRLAIRLADPTTRAGELVALALVHAYCLAANDSDIVWPRLEQGFLVPLDELADVMPLDKDVEGGGSRRADLLYVSAGARGPLELRFLEVKYRRHLRTARDAQLIAHTRSQIKGTRARWQAHFFAENLGSTGRAIRRSALVRLLEFYLNRARRHHLNPDVYQRLRRQIDKWLHDGDEYGPLLSERTDVGYIFCPEMRSAQPEPIDTRRREEAEIYLFGPSLLPEVGLGGVTPTIRPSSRPKLPVEVSTEKDSDILTDDLAETLHGPRAQHVEIEGRGVDHPTMVELGHNVATREMVHWRASLNGNPHLMVVGLPGMGKTTGLINICRQLARAGIYPVVFSYHHDIDARLVEALGEVESVDYQGLGFNPLQVNQTSPVAHIDAASELRDIFAAIFRDLGDLQTEEIRQAIKQSYVDQGWGQADAVAPLASPSFQAFFDLLSAKPRPNAGLMARLNELNDYGFFSAAGNARSLLDINRPVVLRIHRTSNDLLQRAFVSFVLYSIYKDMFRRGLQKQLTHAVVFDEAHRASRLKLLSTMAKECRKYGIALILASQEARDFDSSLYSAVASYLALRLTEHDARIIAKLMSVSGMEARLVDRLKQLPKFHALHFTEGESRPVQIAMTP